MTSPDTIILLIVDCHAAFGGQDPRGPLENKTTDISSEVITYSIITWNRKNFLSDILNKFI